MLNLVVLLEEAGNDAGQTPELANVLFAVKETISREEAVVLWKELFPELLEGNKENLMKLLQFVYSAGKDVGIKAGRDLGRQEIAHLMPGAMDKAFNEGYQCAERLRNGLST